MKDSRWERVGAATGIAFFLVFVVGNAISDITIFSAHPGDDASIGEFTKYFGDKYNLIKYVEIGLKGAVLAGLLVWFSGSLRVAIARTEPDGGRLASIAFAGGALLGLLLLLSAASERAVIDHVQSGIATEETLAVVEGMGKEHTMHPVPIALMTAAAGIASIRFRSLPTWLGWVSLILAAVAGLAAFDVILGGAILLPAVAWIFVTSIVLVIRPVWGRNTPAG